MTLGLYFLEETNHQAKLLEKVKFIKRRKAEWNSVLEQNVNKDKKARNSVVCAGIALTFRRGPEQ